MNDGTPFYLAINYGSDGSDPRKWYKAAPLGKNTINNFMKTMSQAANLRGRKRNHSVRKTSDERLLQANVPPTLIQNITGHKNVQSISNYAKASKRQHFEMQKILTGQSIRSEAQSISPAKAKYGEIADSEHLPVSTESLPLPEHQTNSSPNETGQMICLQTNPSQLNLSSSSMMCGLFSGSTMHNPTIHFHVNSPPTNNTE